MAKRGPKSAAELAIKPVASSSRLNAPLGLTPDEVDVWSEVVQLCPASFFPPEAVEQLAAYCRHAVAARDFSTLIAKFNPRWISADGGLERLDRLSKMRDRETRAMLAVARALRLTNQSRQDPKSAHRRAADGWGGSFYDTMDNSDDER